jgi:hypothetical protein
MLGGTQQRRKTGPRIEPRDAEPIDRAVTADQRGTLGVADDRVVLDREGHEIA